MMQKVRGLISALLCFNDLFHFSFSVPLRYFIYCFIIAFSVTRTRAVECFNLGYCGFLEYFNVVLGILGVKLAFWLRAIQFAWMSSRCKGDAWLSQPRPDCSKCTFRYTYHVTTCLPVLMWSVLYMWNSYV